MQMVGSVLFGADELVADFVARRIPDMEIEAPYVGLGVVRRGQLAAGVVFHRYRKTDIEVVAAADDASWAYPATMRTLFFYPFGTLGLVRMTAVIGRKNKRSRRLIEGLGFTLEGCVRRGLDGRQDAMIYGMLKSECRFLRKTDGQEIDSRRTAAA